MNVKFWVRVNGGCVKLKLEPGQVLSHWSGGPYTDGFGSEYSYEEWTWHGKGEPVERYSRVEASDCDGRTRRVHFDECDVALLKIEVPDGSWWSPHPGAEWFRDHDGVTFPAWGEVKSEQRDFRAEAFGY